MPSRRRYQAPAGHGEVLADPPIRRIPDLVHENASRLVSATARVAGMPLHELRRLARREVYELTSNSVLPLPDLEAPLVLAGHQPELSHPGVWAKNFALAGLAAKVQGQALNLVVDSDTLKSPVLRVPIIQPRDPTAVRLDTIPYDQSIAETPYETRGIVDRALFESFGDTVAKRTSQWGYDTLLSRVWPEVVAHPAATVGGKFAGVRATWERNWGCHNRELAISRLVSTQAFQLFVDDLVQQCDRFRSIYNQCVRTYRETNGIRSRNHPVPDLAPGELPLWGAPTAEGRRTRMLCGPIPDRAQLRPRALTLTLFARVCLGDFFIHGIGGGKYDEVTDAIIREYYQLEPPSYQVITATVQLPVPKFPTTPAELYALAHRERDVYWNPQRYVPAPEAERPEVQDLIARFRLLTETEPFTRAERRLWFQNLRRTGDQLREILLPRMGEAHDWLARARAEVAANAILQRRDYAWVLFPEEVLRPFLRRFLTVW